MRYIRGFSTNDVRVVIEPVAQLLKEETEPFAINDEACNAWGVFQACRAQRFFSNPTGGIDLADFDAAFGLRAQRSIWPRFALMTDPLITGFCEAKNSALAISAGSIKRP